MGRVGFYALRLQRRWLLLALAAAIAVAVAVIALTASGGHPATESLFPSPVPSLQQSPHPGVHPAARSFARPALRQEPGPIPGTSLRPGS